MDRRAERIRVQQQADIVLKPIPDSIVYHIFVFKHFFCFAEYVWKEK
jgi:hypothetical protein